MSSNTIGKTWKCCATCSRWGGTRDPGIIIPSITITFDMNQKGRCYGGGYRNLDMNGMAHCGQWMKWAAVAD